MHVKTHPMTLGGLGVGGGGRRGYGKEGRRSARLVHSVVHG